MPTDYLTTDALQLIGVTDAGGTLSWTGIGDIPLVANVTDDNDDGNLDQGTDSWGDPSLVFTGYTVTVGGNEYAVFSDGTDYFIPYTKADFDLFGSFPSAGSTTDLADNVVAFPLCFAEGTKIGTPDGSCSVEELKIGDHVRTSNGTDVPVKWVGRQTCKKFIGGERIHSVRICAGALANGLPHSDLTVTADHGMILDGLVINASALVNGTTIDWVPMDELPDQVTYYHIETEKHDVILANGAPTETFVDIPGRMAFDNYQEYIDRYGTDRIIPEMDRPRISSRRLLPDAVKARLGIVDDVLGLEMALSA